MMNLTITDSNYLESVKRIELLGWFQRYKGKLYFSALLLICSVCQICFSDRQNPVISGSAPAGQGHQQLLTSEARLYYFMFWYFILFLTVSIIARAFYKRGGILKKIALMNQYEIQVKKVPMKYDLDESRIRIEYGNSFKEYSWSMFQKFHFYKGFLIISNSYRPTDVLWMRIPQENKLELSNLVAAVQSKFKMEVV